MTKFPRMTTLKRMAVLALTAGLLSGCIIVPDHHYRAYPAPYYYR